jgi:hypothetical protein
MSKIIGGCLLIAWPFTLITILAIQEFGIKGALFIWAVAISIIATISLGVYLISL